MAFSQLVKPTSRMRGRGVRSSSDFLRAITFSVLTKSR
jgi:hypothetical protein